MKAQEYLNSLIKEAKLLIENSQKIKSENSSLFEEQDISKVDSEILYKVSAVINDAQTAFKKVSEFIFFCKNIEIELDISELSDAQGLSEFVTKYIPYDLNTSVNENGDVEVKKENYAEKLKVYKNTISALSNISK